MKRRTDIKTKTYEADYGFMVDIVDEVDRRCGKALWNVYLYRESFGIKMHLFGLLKEHTPSIKEAIEIVENNLPDCYRDYDDQYAQDDDVDRGYEDDFDFDEDCDEADFCEDADRLVTCDEWQNVKAGEKVESGFGYKIDAPAADGTYTLYEIADHNNCHVGWKWEKVS